VWESRSAGTAHGRMRVETWCDHVRPRVLVAENTTVRSLFGSSSPVMPAGQRTLRSVAVANAIAVSSGSVSLVRGATSRRKPIEIDVASDQSHAVALALQGTRTVPTSEKRPIPGDLGRSGRVVRGCMFWDIDLVAC
jgi:hypothetical protein